MISSLNLKNFEIILAPMVNSENYRDNYDYEVDARGLNCPMPLLKMKQALNSAKTGEILFVRVTDPASVRDFNSFIEMTQHQLIYESKDEQYLYWIIKG